MVRTTSATRLVHLGQGRTPTSVNNFVVSQASSANGCKRNATATSLGPFIPIQTQSGSEESMSLIVQLGTTVVATTTQQQASVAKSPLTLSGGYPTARIVNSAYREQSPRASLTTSSKCNIQHMPEPQQTTKMKLVDLQEAAAVEKIKLEPMEIKKEEPEEKKHLPYYGIPFEAQTEEQRMEIVKFVLQDHNYGAPPPASPPLSPQHHGKTVQTSMNPLCTTGPSYTYGSGLLALRDAAARDDDDDANSVISSNPGREVEPEGEETETAPEGEGDDEDSVTRCICEFEHDDGYMICCDKCFVWQHVDCMGIDRLNIPDEYMCERCQPRRVDRQRARTLQLRKREELLNTDTCSDTSSTTSTDTESAVMNAGPSAPKRRAASSVNRRKSDQSRSVNKKNVTNNHGSNSNSNNNNNNSGSNNSGNNVSANNHNNNNSVSSSIAKQQRQRRDSVKEPVPATTTQRRSSANQNKKKEPVKTVIENKKPPTRRKSKRCLSEEEGQDVWEKSSSGSMQQLRQWIDNYEEAVTNHYSPELRARISSIKVNGIHSDLKTGNILSMGSGTTKCRVSQTAPGVRILVSTTALSPHQPVIELRGKYMLSTQHRPAALNSVSSKRSRPPPGPFIFFYRLPKDGTEVCVDTRTYGNDARFIRRSCNPNAEVRHCIEKGILHLYIVTATAIEKNCEITIGHDGAHDTGTLGCNTGNGQSLCACGNPKECTAFVKGNGALEISDRERRRRGRRALSSEERDGLSGTNQTQNNVNASETNNSSIETSPPTRRNSSTRSPTKQQQTSPALPPPPPPPPVPQQQETTHQEEENNEANDQKSETHLEQQEKKRKLTREERKMEAIMKAFERLEKAEQRRQENQAKQAHRKEETHVPSESKRSTHHEEKEEVPKQRSAKSATQDRPRRKRRKGRGRASSSNNSSGSGNSAPLRRRTRLNSGDSDMTSADEATHPAMSPSESMSANTNAVCSQQGSPVSAAAGLLLALANGNNASQPNSVSPYQPQTPPHTDNIPRSTTPQGQVFCESSGSGSSQGSTPPTPLSSACLLVAAAVGPLAPGFKFPKTKKVLMNEWLNKSPDPLNSSSIVPPPMSSPVLARPGDLPLNPSDLMLNPAVADSYGFSTQHSPSKSLATLAQAANRVALGTSTSPVPSFCRSVGTKGNAQSPGGRVGSAKKRWLRQAISEECDSPTPNSCASPNSRGGSPPPCPDYVTPLKKRRVARESMSSEQSFTPPTTPTMLADQQLAGASPTSQKCGQYDGANMNLVVDEDTVTSPGEEDNAALHEYDETEEKCVSNFDEHSSPVDADAHCSETGSCHQVVLGSADRVQSEGCEVPVEMDTAVNEKLHIQESEEEDEDEEEVAVHSPTLDRSQEMLDENATELKTEVAHSSEETEEEGCRGFEDQDVDCHYDTVHEEEEGEKPGGQETDKATNAKENSENSDQKMETESTQTAATSSATAQPAKRKVRTLSISEYRQRKQRNSEAENLPRGNENEEVTPGSPACRVRTNSTSSSSSLSSDDDMPIVNKSLLMDTTPALSTLPLFLQSDGVDDKKGAGGEELNYMRWNSAPTLVERQRENLTERLRREFGLFLSDDEEQERVRKQGLAQDAAKDGKKKAPPPPPPPPLPPPEATTVAVSQHLMGMYSSPQKLTYSSVLVPNNVPVSYISPGTSGAYATAGSSRQVQGYGAYPVKTQSYTASYPAGLGGKGITSTTGKGPAPTAAIYQTPTTNVANVKAAPKYLLTTPPPPPPPLPSPTGSQYVVQAPYGTPASTQQVMLVGSSRATSQTPSHFVAPSASGNTAPTGNTTTFYTAAAAKAYYPAPPLPNLPPPPPPPRT